MCLLGCGKLTWRYSGSVSAFPSVYYVEDIAPPATIFRVSRGIQVPVDPSSLASTVVYGLNAVVQHCIARHGDASIARGGIGFARSHSAVSIYVKSHIPGGPIDVTYSLTAKILRGIWELTSSYGYCTVALEIYVGTLNVQGFRGYATVYPGSLANNSILHSDAQIFEDDADMPRQA